jgi:complex iron-sulfur molybdoenzyme family reductase subunit gamma
MTMHSGARWTVAGITLLALIVATALTLTDMRLASSQTVTLVAKRSELDIPLDDPFDRAWNRANPVEAPLSAQILTPPMGGGDRTVKARALHDGERLYVLVEWDDEAEDLLVSRQSEFSDAAAVQFPVTPGEAVPAFCMGDPSAPVNIWQWKAAWQADIEQGYVGVEDTYPDAHVDLYPFEDEEEFYPARAVGNVFAQADRTTSVDNLLAGSFGTLTQAPDQVVQGSGEWRKGKWRVLFARDLTTDGDYSQFAEEESTNIAFAVWDGTGGERDGIKSVSQFLTLEVSPEVAEASGGVTVWLIVLVVLGGTVLALVLALYGRQRGKG